MVVTGFEIYGAVGTSIALLNLARQGYASLAKTYGEFHEYGPQVVAASRHCENIYFMIESWSKYVGIDKPMEEKMYKAYWGEDGWKKIESQLNAVYIKCADLAAILAKALPSAQTYEQIPEVDRERARGCLDQPARSETHIDTSNSRSPTWLRRVIHRKTRNCDMDKKVEEIHVLEEHITRTTDLLKKAKYVLSSSEKLVKHLDALKEDFDELKQLVKTAWRLQHPNIDIHTSTLKEKQIAALTIAHQAILQEARKDRLATNALYRCCSNTKRALKLELSVLDMIEDIWSKRFHIFVPRFHLNECLEVSTVILREDPPLGLVDWRLDFHSACDKVFQKENSLLRISSNNQNGSIGSQRETRQKIWFSLSKRAMHVEGLKLSILSNDMACLMTAERLKLAFSIVETGLILFGTPWLSALSSTTLKRFKAERQPPKYLLDIKEDNNLVQTLHEDAKRDLHLYIYIIGISLVEIALQTMVIDFRRSDFGLDLFIGGPGGVRWRSPSHVVDLVKQSFGKEYSEAVEFCLQDTVHAPNGSWKGVRAPSGRWLGGVLYDKTRNEEEISVELLDLFYDNVLIK